MKDFEETAGERGLSNMKLAAELAELVFRVVQMWIVFALVTWFWRETGSILSAAVAFVLGGAMVVYCWFKPFTLIAEWQNSREGGPSALIWYGWIAGAVLLMCPLFAADPILAAMVEMQHPSPDPTNR